MNRHKFNIVGNTFNYISSNFGVSFSAVSLGLTATFLSSAVSATGRFMLIGSANTGFWISINFGSSWTAYGPIPRARAAAVAMSADGKYMLAAPNITGLMYRSVATTPTVVYPFIFYSTDGINWTPSSTASTISGNCYTIAWNGSMWVAVGKDIGSFSSIKYSYDGLNWLNSQSGGSDGRVACGS
jgi:hypothetical protein